MKFYNYKWRQFDRDIRKIKKLMRGTDFSSIYGIPRGGLIMAVKLSHLLDIPLITDKNKISNWTIICDDISDTGKTLKEFKDYFTITLFWHEQTITMPDIAIREKKNKWIKFPWEK